MAGQAAYDLMIKGLVNSHDESLFEKDVESAEPGLRLGWKPSLQELAEEDALNETHHTPHGDALNETARAAHGDVESCDVWNKLLSSTPLTGAVEKPLAIEDAEKPKPMAQPALEDEKKPYDHKNRMRPLARPLLALPGPGLQDHADGNLQDGDASNRKAADANLQDSEVPKKMKSTFASRYRPQDPIRGIKWDCIRNSYEMHVRAKICRPASLEDNFFKYCMPRLDGLEDMQQISPVADQCALSWIMENPGLCK